MESRTQGSRPRPRTQKNPRTDPPEAKDTSASALQKKRLQNNFSGDVKKVGLQKKFLGYLQKKNVFQKIFQALHKLLTTQTIVLSSSRGQDNFRGLEASRPRTSSRTSPLELTVFQSFRLTFDFFPRKLATCSKPSSRDNHRKAPYPRTQLRDQGAG